MAKIANPPIPHKMYRHFAIITVVLTAMIALFASGENREAMADQVAQQERDAQLQRISAERARGPQITRRENSGQNRFAGGDREDFGRPMMELTASTSSTMENFPSGAATRGGQTMPIPGYSQAYLNSLTEEEYRRLVQNLRTTGMLDAQERAQTLDNLERASERRSGATAGTSGLAN